MFGRVGEVLRILGVRRRPSCLTVLGLPGATCLAAQALGGILTQCNVHPMVATKLRKNAVAWLLNFHMSITSIRNSLKPKTFVY